MNDPNTSQAPPLVLSIRGLRKDRLLGRGEAYCLKVPRLDVRAGEKICITGPSGSGKSTFLDMIGLVLRPDSAERFLLRSLSGPGGGKSREGAVRDIAEAWRQDRLEDLAFFRRGIGYVLQTGGLLPFVNVRENIVLPRRLLGLGKDPLADHLVELLGIGRLLKKLPAQLSVGERQRVAIARALASRPSLILADEPTAALDPANARGVLGLFSHMVAEMNVTLILVSHTPEQIQGMGFEHLAVRISPLQQEGMSGTLALLEKNNAPPPEGEARPPSTVDPGSDRRPGAAGGL